MRTFARGCPACPRQEGARISTPSLSLLTPPVCTFSAVYSLRNSYTAVVMPLIDDHHFSECPPPGWTLDVRGPLGALAELAWGRKWSTRNQRPDAPVKALIQWYERACTLVSSEAYTATGVEFTSVRTRLKKWLAEKRWCLAIAFNEGRIPRVDVWQQVVS